MIGMIRVQLEKVPVMLKNRKILVRTMNLYAEDFFQESRSFPDIFTKRFIPKPFKLQPNSGADASRAMLLSKLSSPILNTRLHKRKSRELLPAFLPYR